MAKGLQKFKDWFFGRLPQGCVSVGGQAVMEGVMMQGPRVTAIAVRQSDGKIVYRTRKTVRPGGEVSLSQLAHHPGRGQLRAVPGLRHEDAGRIGGDGGQPGGGAQRL